MNSAVAAELHQDFHFVRTTQTRKVVMWRDALKRATGRRVSTWLRPLANNDNGNDDTLIAFLKTLNEPYLQPQAKVVRLMEYFRQDIDNEDPPPQQFHVLA
jgi:hypothetical protein